MKELKKYLTDLQLEIIEICNQNISFVADSNNFNRYIRLLKKYETYIIPDACKIFAIECTYTKNLKEIKECAELIKNISGNINYRIDKYNGVYDIY
jgi:hypothetical protein